MATGERASAEHDGSPAQAFLFARQLAAYEFATQSLSSDDTVLDLACGTGYGSARLSQSVGRVTGVDVSTDVIATCRRRYESATCCFESADGTQLRFADDEFTAGVSFQTIEHVQDDAAFVRELRRVIRPGGSCLLTTPNRTQRLRPGQRPWNRFHVREYDAEELRRLLLTVFQDVTIQGVHASATWMAFERERIMSAQRIARLDPFNLRHRVPIGLVVSVRRLFTRHASLTELPIAEATTPLIGIEDFFLSDDIETALDLFALCR